jgi:steroid delta-isomerase-like uncharacterized protein
MTDARLAAIATVTRYYEAFNRGDPDGMVALLGEGFVHDVNQGARREGIEAFAAFCRHMNTRYRETARDIVVMASEDGTRAAAEFVIDGVYLATDEGLPEANGQTYTLPVGSFLELENGRIVRVTTHYNLADWIAQVGGAAA